MLTLNIISRNVLYGSITGMNQYFFWKFISELISYVVQTTLLSFNFVIHS
jgi:hypothetical protein